MGQRLVRGKKVPVEKYLDFRKLSTTQISGLGVLRPVSSKTICGVEPKASLKPTTGITGTSPIGRLLVRIRWARSAYL